MNEFTITTELVNKVLAYLGSKPYAETHELIEAIQREYQLEESRSTSMFADGYVPKEPKSKKVKNIE